MSWTIAEPDDWPGEVPFLTLPTPSPLLSKLDRLKFCSPPLAPPPNDPPHVTIRKCLSRSHPAKGTYGLFCGAVDLDKGSWIRDHLGVVHTEAEADPASDYSAVVFRTQEPSETISVDATEAGNEARYLNDYRNIDTRPNAVIEVREWPLPGGRGVGMRVAVYAARDIKRYEEITVSYGRAYWDMKKKDQREKEKEERKQLRHARQVKEAQAKAQTGEVVDHAKPRLAEA